MEAVAADVAELPPLAMARWTRAVEARNDATGYSPAAYANELDRLLGGGEAS